MRFRTGKWRPVELFSEGRKTCSLSHIRIGNAPLEFKVLRLPDELGDAYANNTNSDVFFEECRGVFNDCLFATAAVPEMMEKPSSSLSFAEVNKQIIEEFEQFVSYVQRSNPEPRVNSSPSPIRYLSVGYIPQTRKKRGRIVADDSVGPVAQRRGSGGSTEELTATDEASAGNAGPKRTLVACAIADYEPATGVVTFLNLTLRVPTLQQGAVDGEIICAVLSRVELDYANGRFPGTTSSTSSSEPSLRQISSLRHSKLSITDITPATSPQEIPKRVVPSSSKASSSTLPGIVRILVPSNYSRWKVQLARLGFIDRDLFMSREPQSRSMELNAAITASTLPSGFDQVFAKFEDVRSFTQ
ncbi:hypothetical protein HDU96_010134, partial [Phlyctochytrium bullatum]